MIFVNFILCKNGFAVFWYVCVVSKMNIAALTSSSFVVFVVLFFELSMIGFGFRKIVIKFVRPW